MEGRVPSKENTNERIDVGIRSTEVAYYYSYLERLRGFNTNAHMLVLQQFAVK